MFRIIFNSFLWSYATQSSVQIKKNCTPWLRIQEAFQNTNPDSKYCILYYGANYFLFYNDKIFVVGNTVKEKHNWEK